MACKAQSFKCTGKHCWTLCCCMMRVNWTEHLRLTNQNETWNCALRHFFPTDKYNVWMLIKVCICMRSDTLVSSYWLSREGVTGSYPIVLECQKGRSYCSFMQTWRKTPMWKKMQRRASCLSMWFWKQRSVLLSTTNVKEEAWTLSTANPDIQQMHQKTYEIWKRNEGIG